MGLSSPDPKKAIAMNTFILVSTQTSASTVYHLKSASTMVSGSHEIESKKDAFSDPAEQAAWDAYKKIEPHYSNANRKLAQ